MPFYNTFITLRGTIPDSVVLLAQLKLALGDSTAVLFRDFGPNWRGKKLNIWSSNDISIAQNLLDTVGPLTPQMSAKRVIQSWPIEVRALLFVMLDQINLIRSRLSPPLGPITPQQVIDAIIAKTDTLV